MHIISYKDFLIHLVKHDGDDVEKHCNCYYEYLVATDLTAEFNL